MSPLRRRKQDPRRSPEAAEEARRKALDAYSLYRLDKDLNDTEQPRKETEPS